VGLVGPHRILGEEVALEPERGLAGDQRQGVGEGEQDQVVVVGRGLDEGPAVVDVDVDAGIGVGMRGRQVTAQRVDLGVDLDRVDPGCSLAQSGGDVVAGARPEDEDVAR
jgi:hypothetical protein